MKTELFTLTKNGLKMHGIAYMSSNTAENGQNIEKKPAIIMSHGFQCNYTGFEFFATKFCEYGYNVFCFNFCGGSSKDDFPYKSDGDSRDMCITSEIEDLTIVFNYVSSLPYVDTNNIMLLGESQGAFVSGLTAARLQEKISKLIMIFPAVCIPDHARRGTLGGANYDPKNPPEEMPLPLTTIGKKYHYDVVDMDAYSELAKYKGDVLLMQGTDDDIVVPQYQYILKDWFDYTDRELQGENAKYRCRLQMIRDMGHMSSETYRDGMFASMRQFIEGREEILSFRIIVTNVEGLISTEDTIEINGQRYAANELHIQDVHFTGYCEGDLFTGTIIEGVDHQIYKGDDCLQMLAEYTFDGVDAEGTRCKLSVTNKWDGEDWKPVISTEDKSLYWLNDADLTAVVENGKLGPTIRVYK